MKISEAIQNIDFSKEHYGWVDDSEFGQTLGLYNSYGALLEEAGMKEYPLKVWLCTDTIVGLHAYFLDGECVAVSWQTARKSSKNIMFTSRQAANKIRDILLSAEDDQLKFIDIENENVEDYKY